MENKVNEIEIPAQYKKLITFYEKRLEIDPDTALEKSRKRFGYKGNSQVYSLVGKYSQTPRAYKKEKKMIHDSKAEGHLVADSVDSEFNEKHGGLITTKDTELLLRDLELQGIDVMGFFADLIRYIKHNDVRESTEEVLIDMARDIPLRKSLSQQVAEKKAQAELMEAERRIERAQSDIMEEYPVQYYHTKTREAIEGEKYSIGTESEGNLYYNENYKEMINDFKEIAFYLQSPDLNRRRGDQFIQQFTIKWAGFRIPQIIEKRQIQARKERQLRVEKERMVINAEFNEEQELEEFLKDLSISDLEEIYNEECGA